MPILHWPYTNVSFPPILAPNISHTITDRFLDMLMSKALGEPNTEPMNYTLIFEVRYNPLTGINERYTYLRYIARYRSSR